MTHDTDPPNTGGQQRPQIGELDAARFQYAWNWFSFHAGQRTTMFNFMLITVGFLATAIGALYEKSDRVLLVPLCLATTVLCCIFTRFDRRNRELVRLAEEIMTEAERRYLFGENTVMVARSGNDEPFGILTAEKRNEDHLRARLLKARWLPGSTLEGEVRLTLAGAWAGKHRIWMPAVGYVMALLFVLLAVVIWFQKPPAPQGSGHAQIASAPPWRTLAGV